MEYNKRIMMLQVARCIYDVSMSRAITLFIEKKIGKSPWKYIQVGNRGPQLVKEHESKLNIIY